MKPSQKIRTIYDERRKAAEEKLCDEIDILFGNASTLEKSIVQYLDGSARWYQKLWWFMRDRCTVCGGEVLVWDSRKAYCKDCRTRS